MLYRRWMLSFVISLLAACGGGGGGSTPDVGTGGTVAPATGSGTPSTGGGTPTTGDTSNPPVNPPSVNPPSVQEAAIRLVAGTSSAPGSRDGVGAAAYFNHPVGLAADSAGTLYVADTGNSTIRKVRADGAVTTLAGKVLQPGLQDGASAQARFQFPGDVVLATDGALYTNDNGGPLRRMNADGAVTTVLAASVRAMTAGPEGSLYLGIGTRVFWYRPAIGLTEIAGQTTFGFDMDGTGSDASFSQFGAMAVDAAGNLFVSQPDSHTVRKITPDHVVTTIAGVSGQSGTVDGKGAGARFNQPRGLAVDASQNVWVSELGSGLLRRIAPDGTVTTPLGYATPLSERPKVQRLAFASGSGNLYFTSDYGVGRFTSTGSVAWLAGHELPVNGVIGEVAGLAVDAVGNVVVQSALGPLQTSTLRKYAPGGEPVPFGSNDSVVVHSPFAAISTSTESIGADASGNIYVSDLYSKGYAFQFDIFSPTGGAINMVAPSGTLTQVANWPADSANAVAPAYLAAGSDGALYFVDLLSGNLLKWTAGAGANVLASTGPPRTSLFDLGPRWSLAADGTGTVYVRMDGALRKVVNGALVTIAGASSFVAPGAIVADSAGNVYVADREVIRKVAVDGTVTTVAGQRGSVGLATGALPGGLGTIGAMALAPGGVLYVISDNALVRVKLP